MVCKQCGECCKFISIIFRNIPEDMRGHINAHKNMVIIGDKVFIRSKCKYLKKNKCSIYPNRFDVCKKAGCVKEVDIDWPLIKRWLHNNNNR